MKFVYGLLFLFVVAVLLEDSDGFRFRRRGRRNFRLLGSIHNAVRRTASRVVRLFRFPRIVEKAVETRSDYFGGSGGEKFTDSGIWNKRPITAIKMICGRYVLMVQVKYGNTWGPEHGTRRRPGAKEEKVINLERDEYIVRVLTSYDKHVNSVQFFTNKVTYDTCGTPGGKSVNSTGNRLLYISGRSGHWMDSIRYHWAKFNSFPVEKAVETRSDYFGGSGGEKFTDSGIWNKRPITAVKMICGRYVLMIQVKYGSIWGPEHGTRRRPGAKEEKVINLERDEYIVRVLTTYDVHVNSVQMFTNKVTYDTCGTPGGKSVNSTGKRLLYISGRSGHWMDSIRYHWAKFNSLSEGCGGKLCHKQATCVNNLCACNTGLEGDGVTLCTAKDKKTDCPSTAQVTCQKKSGETRTICNVPDAERVTYVSAPSKTSCAYGSSYGRHGDDVWVQDSCSGIFDVCYIPVPPPPPPPPPEECRDSPDGLTYNGTQALTATGKKCQEWSSQTPHTHSFTTLPENYCRNPDGSAKPWCYTADPNTRWEYCNLPFCDKSDAGAVEECLSDDKGMNYIGYKSVTASGLFCQNWDSNVPHSHSFIATMATEANYCRNPDGHKAPWCYTTDPNKRWEACSIPECAECNVEEEEAPDCRVLYKLTGKCHYNSHVRNLCKYTVNLLEPTKGKPEATIKMKTKTHKLAEGDTIKDCATFTIRRGVLEIMDKGCSENCKTS